MSTPTQAPYEIAKFLTDEAKRAAVARSYTPIRNRSRLDPYVCPRCASGMCPIGVALLEMTGTLSPTPGPHFAAYLLGEPGVWYAVDRFMEDWDMGRIADLAAAWGVAS
jgi:hypothetical protein